MCEWLVDQSGRTHFWIDEPLSTLTQWPQGSTCPLVLDAPGTCTRGGYPEYVVNATTVKHIQAAVNFARNKNVRNAGYDFGGRSMGAGSLSVWVHNLKDFEFIPEYTVGRYSGMAVRVWAGVESWEHFNHMAANNISVVAPGGSTIGAVGRWISVAGYGALTNKYGLGADQVLSINVITADGHFLTVDPTSSNRDLWWALRGGGPTTRENPPPGDPNALTNLTAFWDGVSFASSRTSRRPPTSPSSGRSTTASRDSHGIPVTLPTNPIPTPYAGDFPINARYRSRLFPARLWDGSREGSWSAVFEVIRAGVEEAGYTFHGIAYYSPTREVAGWPASVPRRPCRRQRGAPGMARGGQLPPPGRDHEEVGSVGGLLGEDDGRRGAVGGDH
ncbi:FAD-binding domain-containing protein [Thermothelomyces heterothallicus CBS 203.75]